MMLLQFTKPISVSKKYTHATNEGVSKVGQFYQLQPFVPNRNICTASSARRTIQPVYATKFPIQLLGSSQKQFHIYKKLSLNTTPKENSSIGGEKSKQGQQNFQVAQIFALALMCVTLQGVPSLAVSEIQGVPRVVDGDTLDFSGTRVRLFGIDAPESKQMCTRKGAEYACGNESTTTLQQLIGQRNVLCKVKDTDMYGRNVSVCQAAIDGRNVDLNGEMVKQGQAVAYRQFTQDYVESENLAKSGKKGLWSGEFTPPNEYRKENKQNAQLVANSNVGLLQPTSTCQIKGNINQGGDRIYHVPGGRYFESTKITPETGERFFCTEKEAEAAGWRKSQQ